MLFYQVWFANLDIFYKAKLINSNFLQYFHTFLSKIHDFSSKVNYLHIILVKI